MRKIRLYSPRHFQLRVSDPNIRFYLVALYWFSYLRFQFSCNPGSWRNKTLCVPLCWRAPPHPLGNHRMMVNHLQAIQGRSWFKCHASKSAASIFALFLHVTGHMLYAIYHESGTQIEMQRTGRGLLFGGGARSLGRGFTSMNTLLAYSLWACLNTKWEWLGVPSGITTSR